MRERMRWKDDRRARPDSEEFRDRQTGQTPFAGIGIYALLQARS